VEAVVAITSSWMSSRSQRGGWRVASCLEEGYLGGALSSHHIRKQHLQNQGEVVPCSRRLMTIEEAHDSKDSYPLIKLDGLDVVEVQVLCVRGSYRHKRREVINPSRGVTTKRAF